MNYGDEDLRAASEFREGIHKEALKIVIITYPRANTVFDRYPVEAYIEDVWNYPGQWYNHIAVPKEAGGRSELIRTIVQDTLDYYRTGNKPKKYNYADLSGAGQKKPGLERIFADKPARWERDGDPYFWDHLCKEAKNYEIRSADELERWIKNEYKGLFGAELTAESEDRAEQFARPRKSDGTVSGKWRTGTGIPLLKSRL